MLIKKKVRSWICYLYEVFTEKNAVTMENATLN